ncbi:fibulin-1-like isoform X1 [Brienomyrus brachyistius]|uniref:fibulin-1-like isoform X1 n=1 Tax=Brienomyrus brachyistius TaxID=42636 RepID=UPI0020B347D2|nr:fibulin-1-like isoform X1 [Brienomyrus brachyistius]
MTTFGYKQRLFPVRPRISMLFSLCCVLLRQETQAISLEDCCKDGHQRGAQREDCTSLPLISETNGCRIVQEQCCTAKLEDIFCNQGIDMAKDQGACEALLSGSSCETKTARMCCDCCLLGRLLQDQGQTCTSSLLVAHQCKMVSQACCSNETPEDQNGTTSDTGGNSGPVSGVNNLAQSDWCRAARCTQHCLGNGTCGCRKGYKLKADGRNCEDINECLLGSHNCLPGERCINTAGHYRCLREMSCGTGYELTESNKCEDINECELGTHNCGPHLDCKNLQGSFRCIPREQCGEGYIQEALGNCIDINECMSLAMPCPPGQMCLNTAGSYECQRNNINCGRGYHLNEEGTRCVDVDECQGPDAPCSGHGCINLVGSFRCECRVGYLYNSITRTCEDNNECRHYPGRLCAHKCENTLGSYKCSCTAGFRLATDGRNCDDVNECDSNPCSQECANVYGSYQCYCRRGYQLSDTDGVNCEDIDECALPTGGHICAYRCHNTPGSFLCSCPSFGYSLAPNGRSCQDINECVAGTHSCSVAESCFNIQGGFRCLSFECPSNYRRAGEARSWVDRSDIIRCVKSCQPNDISCILDPVHSVSHTVISMPTYREFNKPEEIVFLRTMLPAHLGQTMANPDIVFDILEGNTQNYFDIIKRYEDNMAVGVVRQVKPIVGPLNTILKLTMNYVLSGVVSHRNMINVHVFVSEFWF